MNEYNEDEIYNLMADEESKRLFRLRMDWADKRDDFVPFSMMSPLFSYGGTRYSDALELLDALRKEEDVVVFCSGGQGSCVTRMLRSLGVKVSSVADNNTAVQGKLCENLTVISAADLQSQHRDALVVIASYEHQAAIKEQLLSLGFAKDRLCYFDNGNRMQYFDTDIVVPKPNKEEVFVDGGCYNFNTSMQFLEWRGLGEAHVIAFEPDEANAKKCNNRLELERQHREISADIIPAGMWSESTTLTFAGTSTEGSRIDELGNTKVDVKALDDVVGEKKATLLKMDIEGAELEALKGAKETIARDKPRLAICVYHKPKDVCEISSFIHSLVPEYRFYLRHYSLCEYETVLYAVI